MRERAEILCTTIEALFYYVRIIDKDQYYEGLSWEEILEEFSKMIKRASRSEYFSFKGPFSDITEKPFRSDTSVAFWSCEKDKIDFFIKATVSAKELNKEDGFSSLKGLKCTLLPKNGEELQDYVYFPINDLTSRIETFYKNILKKWISMMSK